MSVRESVHLLRILPREETERLAYCETPLRVGSLTTINRVAATCATCLRFEAVERGVREALAE